MAGLHWALGRGRRLAPARAMAAVVSAASRQPGFYGEGRAPDTLEGRLEMLILHACLALIRLKQSPGQEAAAQDFADVLFREIDAGLREEGIGDLSVPRRMRKIASQFYGRLAVYEAALSDRAALAAAFERNIFGAPTSFALVLADYAAAVLYAFSQVDPAALAQRETWPAAPV